MSEMVIHVQDFGTIEAEIGRLESMANATKFMSPVMKAIMRDMAVATEKQIRSEGRRGGGSYRPLKEGTIKKKGIESILYTSGAKPGYSEYGGNTLVRSVTNVTSSNQFTIREYTEHSVTFGTRRPYADVHQYGSIKRKIPARPFLRFTEGDTRRWEGMILDHLMAPYRHSKFRGGLEL